MIVAVDIGYGYTKAVGAGKSWRQPSVVGDARELFEGSIKPSDVQLTSNGKTYFVGDLAVRQSLVPYFGTGDNKAMTWTTGILLKAALGVVSPRDGAYVVTGLPVDYYFKQKADFEKILQGFNNDNTFLLKIGSECISCRPWITNYKVVPQPFGAAMNYLLDDKGQIMRPQAAQGRMLVVDIGYYTLDLLVLDRMEIGRESRSPERLGIDTAYNLITAELREKVGRAPARNELDRYIRGGTYEGVDILPIRARAFEVLARQISAEVQSLNMRFDRYIVTGGWAAEIAPLLGLPADRTIIFDGLGNAEGYRKIGVRLWQKSSADYAPAKTTI